jgi:heptosyltransferase I
MKESKGLGARLGRSSKGQRFLDFWVGIPLLWILGLTKALSPKPWAANAHTLRYFLTDRAKKKIPHGALQVALLKASAIGDTVILSATLRELKKAYPQTQITWFVGKSNLQAAELVLAGLGETSSETGFCRLQCLPMTRPLSAVRIIRETEFDIFLDFGTWSRLEALYCFFSRSILKLGFKSPGQGRHFAYTKAVAHDPYLHESLNYLRLLQALGVDSSDYQPRLKFDIDYAPSLLGKITPPGPWIICHLKAGGSQATHKEWPDKSWQTLIVRLINEKNISVLLTGGPADRSALESFVESFRDQIPPGRLQILAGLSLVETSQSILLAKLVISIDTGLLHLASALDVPLIGLFGATHSKHWGPLGAQSLAIDACELSEAPLQYGFEKVSGEWTSRISVERVWSEILKKITTLS